MLRTRTGEFPIGFRECFEESIEWAVENGFRVLDLVGTDLEKVGRAHAAGLSMGSIDLPNFKGLLSPDPVKRGECVAVARRFVEQSSAMVGTTRFFCVMLPEDPGRDRRENHRYMVDSYGELSETLSACDARLVIEGWPGPGALCCTPEGYRRFFDDCRSDRMGVNYDPSHLIRMGIDPLRFLRDFVHQVYHVHAKDTEILDDRLYRFGCEIPAIFEGKIRYGAFSWRYTLPGFGQMRWTEAFRILSESGYTGAVSIELEDANFCETVALKQEGLSLAGRFLTGC